MDVPVPQNVEDIVEVVIIVSQARIVVLSCEHIMDVFVPRYCLSRAHVLCADGGRRRSSECPWTANQEKMRFGLLSGSGDV